MVAQIIRRVERGPGFQQLRAARRKHLILHQQLNGQPGITPQTAADRGVEIAAGQVDDLIGR
jgi:hypothetical protein